MHMPQHRLLVVGLFAIGFVLSLASSRAAAQTYTNLHDFNCFTEGCSTQFPDLLAQGRDGNLYGTHNYGGTTGNCGDFHCGTVFQATPSGITTTLYNFGDVPTGEEPLSGLTLGTDGNFYGATYYAGANGYGTLFNITPAGALTTLHSFASSEGHDWGPATQGKDGNFYGVTYGGLAYKISLKGVYQTLSSSIPPYATAPLMQASDGNFYGSSVYGGGCGLIFRMSTTGKVTTVYGFDKTHGCQPYGPLVQDAKGYLYGTTDLGGLSTTE